MDTSQIRIILARPEESRNIGSVCRAMANGGMHRLRIVGRREDYDEGQIQALAIHARHIWDEAEFFSDISSAAADCSFAAGTTRRRGKKRKDKLLLPEEFADLCTRSSPCEAALVFGNERTGLTDDELNECNMAVTIPSSEHFASLNLSHAVQIFSYLLFCRANPHSPGSSPVSRRRLAAAAGQIGENLQSMGFFSITGRKYMEGFWQDILCRAALSEGETQYIEKIFNKAAGLFRKKSAP